MASNSEEYELTCFGKYVDKCSIFAGQVLIILICAVLIFAVGVVALVSIGGIGVNIYNVIYHISPFGSYDNDERKYWLSYFGLLAIGFWIAIATVTILVLWIRNYENIKMYCTSICKPLLYKKVVKLDSVQHQLVLTDQANVITATDMV